MLSGGLETLEPFKEVTTRVRTGAEGLELIYGFLDCLII